MRDASARRGRSFRVGDPGDGSKIDARVSVGLHPTRKQHAVWLVGCTQRHDDEKAACSLRVLNSTSWPVAARACAMAQELPAPSITPDTRQTLCTTQQSPELGDGAAVCSRPPPLRIVKFIARKPLAMCCLSMGVAVLFILVLVIGAIYDFVPVGIDYSIGQLNVKGDEIADRHRAIQAAQKQSSRYGPAEIALRLLPLPPSAPPPPLKPPAAPATPALPPPPTAPPPVEWHYRFRRIGRLQLFVERRGAENASIFDDDELLLAVAALQDAITAAPALGDLCKRSDEKLTGAVESENPDLSTTNCTGFVGPLRVLRAPERQSLARFSNLDIPLLGGGSDDAGSGDDSASVDVQVSAATAATSAATASLAAATLPSSTLGSGGGSSSGSSSGGSSSSSGGSAAGASTSRTSWYAWIR